MICAVYRSKKRTNTYLFVEKKGDFSNVPESLLDIFGTPEFSMFLRPQDMPNVKVVSPEKLQAELREKHYYLWVRPEDENLLNQHRAEQANAETD